MIMNYEHKIALINLSFCGYLRRRILELNGGWPETTELHSTLSRVFTEYFHDSITDRSEQSLKIFADLIHLNLLKYTHALPDYDLIEFIEFAEKYVKEEIKSARRWCPSLAYD